MEGTYSNCNITGEPQKWNVATLRILSLETERLRWRHSTFKNTQKGIQERIQYTPTPIALHACDGLNEKHNVRW